MSPPGAFSEGAGSGAAASERLGGTDAGALLLGAGGVLAGAAAGGAAALAPAQAAVAAAAAALVLVVALRPALGAWLVLGLTPLLVGVDRGAVLPLLRPSEALLLLVAAGVGLRRLHGWSRGGPLLPWRVGRLDGALVGLALSASALPLIAMWVRGDAIEGDDVLYALQLWKYLLLYAVVRAAVQTEAEVRGALFALLAGGVCVALVGLAQVLGVPGVRDVLAAYFAPFERTSAVDHLRATATLASSQATADVMTFSLVIVLGCLHVRIGRPLVLWPLAALFLAGVVAAGQVSGVAVLLAGLLSVGLVTGRLGRVAAASIPAGARACALLWPVIDRRLQGFDTPTGLPASWQGRLDNLQSVFLPQLSGWDHLLLGVRPAARVAAPEPWRQWIFIESGFVWLVWTGGIVCVIAFTVYVAVASATLARLARLRLDAIGAAAIGALGALAAVTAGMVFDPHLTLRGTGELSFGLLALAASGCDQRDARS